MALVANKDGIITAGTSGVDQHIPSRLEWPDYDADPVVPDDAVNLPRIYNRLFAGGAGVVQLVNPDNTVTAWTVPAGGYIDNRFKRVNATGTTATLLIGLI